MREIVESIKRKNKGLLSGVAIKESEVVAEAIKNQDSPASDFSSLATMFTALMKGASLKKLAPSEASTKLTAILTQYLKTMREVTWDSLRDSWIASEEAKGTLFAKYLDDKWQTFPRGDAQIMKLSFEWIKQVNAGGLDFAIYIAGKPGMKRLKPTPDTIAGWDSANAAVGRQVVSGSVVGDVNNPTRVSGKSYSAVTTGGANSAPPFNFPGRNKKARGILLDFAKWVIETLKAQGEDVSELKNDTYLDYTQFYKPTDDIIAIVKQAPDFQKFIAELAKDDGQKLLNAEEHGQQAVDDQMRDLLGDCIEQAIESLI